MKILQWNIRHGGGIRAGNIVREIEKEGSDVVILTEFRNNRTGLFIKTELLKQGYSYQHARALLNPESNSVAVFSKIKLFEMEVPKELYDRVIKLSHNNIDIYAMYFPQKNEKDKLFDYIVTSLTAKTSNNLFIGDFNTGKNTIDKTEGGTNFCCEKRLYQIENLDAVDCWRYFNGEVREYTWYSKKKGRNYNGFRIDLAFINSQYIDNVKNCTYRHDVRINGISDHSMLVIEVELKS